MEQLPLIIIAVVVSLIAVFLILFVIKSRSGKTITQPLTALARLSKDKSSVEVVFQSKQNVTIHSIRIEGKMCSDLQLSVPEGFSEKMPGTDDEDLENFPNRKNLAEMPKTEARQYQDWLLSSDEFKKHFARWFGLLDVAKGEHILKIPILETAETEGKLYFSYTYNLGKEEVRDICRINFVH